FAIREHLLGDAHRAVGQFGPPGVVDRRLGLGVRLRAGGVTARRQQGEERDCRHRPTHDVTSCQRFTLQTLNTSSILAAPAAVTKVSPTSSFSSLVSERSGNQQESLTFVPVRSSCWIAFSSRRWYRPLVVTFVLGSISSIMFVRPARWARPASAMGR